MALISIAVVCVRGTVRSWSPSCNGAVRHPALGRWHSRAVHVATLERPPSEVSASRAFLKGYHDAIRSGELATQLRSRQMKPEVNGEIQSKCAYQYDWTMRSFTEKVFLESPNNSRRCSVSALACVLDVEVGHRIGVGCERANALPTCAGRCACFSHLEASLGA